MSLRTLEFLTCLTPEIQKKLPVLLLHVVLWAYNIRSPICTFISAISVMNLLFFKCSLPVCFQWIGILEMVHRIAHWCGLGAVDPVMLVDMSLRLGLVLESASLIRHGGRVYWVNYIVTHDWVAFWCVVSWGSSNNKQHDNYVHDN